ncbi:MAG: sodium:proton antiporter [Candidatus Asgardarchaeia archaeon]|uniref:Cation:proton antiporter n=1 Tax=Aerophobetes bacterium TaxID=2030807 RepID=A0A7V5HXR5_UNCAE|nr:cation:proton antiporter [Candidatus Aerophobetes bacterium]
MIFFLSFVIFLIGLYCVVIKKNLLKIVMGIVIMEYAVNFFLVSLGYRKDGVAPIVTEGVKEAKFVDPLPQAMVLTAIVISIATLAFIVAMCIRIYQRYHTFDVTEIRKLKG